MPVAEVEGKHHLVRYANPAFCRLVGQSREALAGRPFAEAMRESQGCLAALDRAYRSGEAETHTEAKPSGRQAGYLSCAVSPVLDQQQRPTGAMVQVIETAPAPAQARAVNEALLISSVRQHERTGAAEKLNGQLRKEMAHRQHVEAALRESEEQYRTLVSQVKDYAIFRTDVAGTAVSWNEGVKEILGFSREEFIGQDVVGKIFTPEDLRAGVADRELRTAAAEGSASDDRWLRRKDGTRFFAQGVTVALKDGAGGLMGFTKIFRDMTRQKEAEDALRSSETRLQRAFEFDQAVMASMSEGLYTIDREGLLTSMNPAAEALFGWRFAELKGQNLHNVTHHHHPDRTLFPAGECPLLRVIQTGEPLIDREDEFVRKDGSFFPVIYSAAPVRGGFGIAGLVVVFRDITDRQAAQERERALANEIAHRNKNLLAIIQTIVSRSLAEKRTAAEARGAIMQRLQAIAKSQSALESGGFVGASLDEITRLEFEALSGRIEAVGPKVLLNPQAAQTFAMLLHELGTNAMKYGALSSPDGRVSVEWSVEGADADAQFRFRWIERGGPPVAPRTRLGFGSALIEKIVAQDFGTKPEISFAREGLHYEIDVALSVIAPEAAAIRA